MVAGTAVRLDARTKRRGHCVSALVAVTELVLACGAGTQLLFPDQVDRVGETTCRLFDQGTELGGVRRAGARVVLVGGKESEIGPVLAGWRELEGIFELVTQQVLALARHLLVLGDIQLSLPP